MTMKEKPGFASDYMRGAHPSIVKAMTETNMISTVGYGKDEISERARERIRKACDRPGAAVELEGSGGIM